MNSSRRALPFLALGALPLAWHELYRRTYAPKPPAGGAPLLPQAANFPPDFFLSEDCYAQQMSDKVLPYLKARGRFFFFSREGRIRCAHFAADAPRATLVLSPDVQDSMGRWSETIYYLLKLGLSVDIIEHYGHGKSASAVQNPRLIHVSDFDRYAKDLQFFIRRFAAVEGPRPLVLLGQGMGAVAAIRALELEEDLADGTILSAPLLSLITQKPESSVFPLALALAKSPWARRRAAGPSLASQTALDGESILLATGSPARVAFDAKRRYEGAQAPRQWPTWGWLSEMLKAAHEVAKPEAKAALTLPLLLLHGTDDFVSSPNGRVCK
ncbi:hypothetical protein ABB02_01241 [Clostridiaceae bacterium JG1575]|nr:hypothetical protein ABB02_01241 [Clostridiaceae bacterium JG1575]